MLIALSSNQQAVDPDVTGPPVVSFYSIQHMQQGYVRGGLYAFITIVGLTLLPLMLRIIPLHPVPASPAGLTSATRIDEICPHVLQVSS